MMAFDKKNVDTKIPKLNFFRISDYCDNDSKEKKKKKEVHAY